MIGKLIDFKINGDNRGSLIAIENNHNVPFDIKRVYYIFDTKKDVRRGFHAHKNLKQLAISVSGSCKFLLDNGKDKEYIELNSPNQGLLLDGLVWREMFDFSEDCVLLVLTNEYYDENDYIRDYSKFLEEINND
ncbi:FdtA/QdtA family cupin domain-containing protein [Halarcobacter sp.]|uniref:sugar 3,4-ketoisomerase n=1 Tax=Halarcobacter sp. TaxID=2321133 RepID=UPI002AA6B2EE|nr:FdtA/QdtA family cupin domain-containing protein [Halarcobacter sp.]